MTEKDVAFFNAIQHTPNLCSGLVNTLIARIESGDLTPGQRLPTEQAIMMATGSAAQSCARRSRRCGPRA